MKKLNELRQTRRASVKSLIAVALASSLPGRLFGEIADGAAALPDTTRQESARARQLLAVARTLFPHDSLSDRYYWPIVVAIDAATSDQPAAKTVAEGLEVLGPGFAELDPAAREAALAKLEGSPFFAFMHAQTLNGLYLNRDVWPMFGFEGSSVEHGGYLHRGFDSIDWLPRSAADK